MGHTHTTHVYAYVMGIKNKPMMWCTRARGLARDDDVGCARGADGLLRRTTTIDDDDGADEEGYV